MSDFSDFSEDEDIYFCDCEIPEDIYFCDCDFSDFSDDEDIYCCDCDCTTTSSNHGTTKTTAPSKTACRYCSEPYHWNPAIGHWCCSCGIQKSGMEYSDRICEICDLVRIPGDSITSCVRCGLYFNTY